MTIAAIVVNYNYAKYVSGALTSVLDQSTPFDEVIAVDDGSTDNSIEIISAFGSHVRVVTKENGGQLNAVLAAVATTDCDYVYVLDADDLAVRDLVRTVTPLLASKPVKVQFQLHSMEANGKPIDSVFPSYAEGYNAAAMVDDNEKLGFYVCPPTSGNVFSREFLASLDGVGLNERDAFDGVPAQLAPYFGEIVSLNQPLARYRVHDSSDSQWGKPTPELLRSEIERYEKRWTEVVQVLDKRGVPAPRTRRSAFLLERELMTTVLQSKRVTPKLAAEYARTVMASGLGAKQRLFFAGWAAGLVVLPNSAATNLVVSRRSSRKRGRLMQLVARLARSRG